MTFRISHPFDERAAVTGYEDWYSDAGRKADVLEKRLLAKLLKRFPEAQRVLEVGCGTGHFTRWFAAHGLQAVGLDISTAMLTEAHRLNGLLYLEGDALALPFRDGEFDLVTLITTLEFLADPARALAEAVRVARQGVLLGVLNRWSWLALRRCASRKLPWRSARFFLRGN